MGVGSLKRLMMQKYGPKCWINILKLRKKDTQKEYKGKNDLNLKNSITYHHLIRKEDGGEVTEENGALLSVESHEWLNKQTPEKQEEINDLLRAYKRRANFAIFVTELRNMELKKLGVVHPDTRCSFEIPTYDNTKEDMKFINKCKEDELKEINSKNDEKAKQKKHKKNKSQMSRSQRKNFCKNQCREYNGR